MPPPPASGDFNSHPFSLESPRTSMMRVNVFHQYTKLQVGSLHRPSHFEDMADFRSRRCDLVTLTFWPKMGSRVTRRRLLNSC